MLGRPISNATDDTGRAIGWRTWFESRECQWGLRLAVAAPFVTLLGGFVVVSTRDLHPEFGLSWLILHYVAFGAIQWVWLAPVAALSAMLGRKRFALGLLIGGGALSLANAVAWLVGTWVGAV
jgi:hypothetical protein